MLTKDDIKKTKCDADGCCTLFDRVMVERGHKGFQYLHTVNMKTGETNLYGVLYKHTRRDNGVIVNACPWCRYEFKAWRGADGT